MSVNQLSILVNVELVLALLRNCWFCLVPFNFLICYFGLLMTFAMGTFVGQITNGNGSINNETTADNSKTQIVTGDRQFLPVTGSSLVTSPVPGEPTANVNQEAP
jgi:hypothetical protein